jgi:MFS family permease
VANTNTQTVPSGTIATASALVVWTMAFAQFGLFVALLAPVTVSLAVKTQTLVTGANAAAVNGNVLAVAAFVAMIANPVFGRLSDLTTSRWGRRRPWLVIGGLLFVVALAIVAIAPNVPVLLAGWCLAQLAGNAILAPLLATIADQVPERQRGGVSANVGVMQNIGILAAAYSASFFVHNMILLFGLPAIFALATILLYVFVLPDKPITERPPTAGWLEFAKTFWVNPVRHPDFGYAWISRFLLTLAAFLFISYRLFYLQNQLGLNADEATQALAAGVLVYTVGLVLTAKLGGWLSDRTGRRKVFVITSTLVFAVGLVVLAHIHSLGWFYVVEAVMGLGFGIYVAVDTALVIDVLPNKDNAAKDLGVLNIANALPQSLAAALGAVLLGIGSATSTNYLALLWGAGILCALGGLAIVPIRGVR